MALEHYQTAFEPLLYGVALAIVLTLLLKETGPAGAAGGPIAGAARRIMSSTEPEPENTNSCSSAADGLDAGPDRRRASLRGDGAGGRARGRARKGLIAPILVGPAAKIAEIGRQAGTRSRQAHGSSTRRTATPRRRRPWSWCAEGEAELLMKGSLHTDELLGAVVARETGLRTGRRISHVFIMDVPTYHKVLIVTDAAINIAPTLEDKVDICQNAIDLAISLGVATAEGRDPRRGRNGRLEDAGDASTPPRSARWPNAGRSRGGVLDGPLAFDNAISARGGEDQGHQVAGRRRSRHPAGAGSRSRQHPGQAAHASSPTPTAPAWCSARACRSS